MKVQKKKLLKYFKELGKTYQKEAEVAARDKKELKAIEEEVISRFVRATKETTASPSNGQAMCISRSRHQDAPS